MMFHLDKKHNHQFRHLLRIMINGSSIITNWTKLKRLQLTTMLRLGSNIQHSETSGLKSFTIKVKLSTNMEMAIMIN